MNRVVYKYEIPLKSEFDLRLPGFAKILHVDTQFEIPQLWALVLPDEPEVTRHFILAGTGIGIVSKKRLEHHGSFLMANGGLVFHLFEVL